VKILAGQSTGGFETVYRCQKFSGIQFTKKIEIPVPVLKKNLPFDEKIIK
jgi:hypothetical protein